MNARVDHPTSDETFSVKEWLVSLSASSDVAELSQLRQVEVDKITAFYPTNESHLDIETAGKIPDFRWDADSRIPD